MESWLMQFKILVYSTRIILTHPAPSLCFCRLVIHTLFVIETQLTSFILAPAKHSSRQREGEAVVSPRRYLCERNPCQRLEGLREQLAGLSFPQTELAVGVLTPREQLAIFKIKRGTTVTDHGYFRKM